MGLADVLLMTLITIFSIGIGLFIGRLLDTSFRCSLLNKIGRNRIVMNIVEKTGRVITSKVVNPEKDTIFKNQSMWVVSKGRIYRKAKHSDGFILNNEFIRVENGVPTIYVDYDSIKPLSFYSEETKVRPDEIGAPILAYIENEKNKGLGSNRKMELFVILILILSVFTLFVSYNTMQEVEKMQKIIIGSGGEQTVVIPEGATIEDGKIVIRQEG